MIAIVALFAVPIPRMVWAFELLVALAAMLMVWRLAAAVAEAGRARQMVARRSMEEVLA
jgi:hypothetical protein